MTNQFKLLNGSDSQSYLDMSPEPTQKQPLLFKNDYECGDESDELEDSVERNNLSQNEDDSDSNDDHTPEQEDKSFIQKEFQNEPEYEEDDNEINEDLGDKIDYNDNLSKASTLATSNENAFKVNGITPIATVVTAGSRAKSKRKIV